jgi:hypothetical protein
MEIKTQLVCTSFIYMLTIRKKKYVIIDWFRFAKDREEGRKRREQESRQRREP